MTPRNVHIVQQIAEPIDYVAPVIPPGIEKWGPFFPPFLLRPRALPISIAPHLEATKTYLIITLTGNKLLAPMNLTETWKEHFAARGWNTIRDQVDAGYPIYAQPVPQTADYKEVVDYGTILTNVIVNIDYATAPKYGTVHTSCSIRHSLDGVNWSAPVIATSMFVQSFRFIEVTIKFEAVS